MTVPKNVRDAIKQSLSSAAMSLDWDSLGQVDKARHYEMWTRDPNIGGVLDRYMDRGKIRVYIKDTLLKDFVRIKLADPALPMRLAGIDPKEEFVGEYIKPHGRRTRDGRVICWGRAEDWKMILLAMHERAYLSRGTPAAAVLLNAAGRFMSEDIRELVGDAAMRLGIGRVIWAD